MNVHLNSVSKVPFQGTVKTNFLKGSTKQGSTHNSIFYKATWAREACAACTSVLSAFPWWLSLDPLGCGMQCLTCLSRKTASLHLPHLTLQELLGVVWRTSHPMHVCCHRVSSLCAVLVPLSTVRVQYLCLNIFQLISILTCHSWQLAFRDCFPGDCICFTELWPYCQGQISYEVKFVKE